MHSGEASASNNPASPNTSGSKTSEGELHHTQAGRDPLGLPRCLHLGEVIRTLNRLEDGRVLHAIVFARPGTAQLLAATNDLEKPPTGAKPF